MVRRFPKILYRCLPYHQLMLQDLVDPSQYLQLFPAAFAPKKSQFDLTSLSTLYNSVDFIGISAYPSLTPNFTLSQIESATQQFDLEIQNFGINVKDLIFNKVPQALLPHLLAAMPTPERTIVHAARCKEAQVGAVQAVKPAERGALVGLPTYPAAGIIM